MARNKTYQSKQRKKKAAKRTQPGKRVGRILNALSEGDTSKVEMLGRSLLDPFDCIGCIPDGANNVGCFSVKDVTTLSTAATNSCVMYAWCPRIWSAYYKFDNTAAATMPAVTGTWNVVTQATTISSIYASYRTISAGFRMTYYGNTQTDGGGLFCGLVSGEVPLSNFNLVPLSTARNYCMSYETIPLRNGVEEIWKPLAFEDMSEWASLDVSAPSGNTLAVGVAPGIPYNIMIAYGLAASQQSLVVEAITNYEGMFRNTTFAPGGANYPSIAPVVGWYEKVQKIIANVEPIVPMLGGAVSGYATGGVRGAVMGALGTLANGLPAPGPGGSSRMPRIAY